MKASLFAEDEEESDLFQDHRAMKVSTDISSPRLVLPGAQSRPSGRKQKPLFFLFGYFAAPLFIQWSFTETNSV